jgi:hypothetical protein
MASSKKGVRRERRVFSAEFKAERVGGVPHRAGGPRDAGEHERQGNCYNCDYAASASHLVLTHAYD